MKEKIENKLTGRFMAIARFAGLAGMMLVVLCPQIWAAAETFPTYASIEPNIDFWTKIYAEFESDKGVIHDKYRLDVIYEVIDLKPPDTAGSRVTNRQRVKNTKAGYRSILDRLAKGNPPQNEVEKRVQRLFGSRATPADFQAATHHLRCQVGLKDHFRAGLIRSGAYIDSIKTIFRENNLPEALAYLPHVESSFHPKAYSKSGAAGIWQFTRATGQKYLQMTSDLDERWDPLAASNGAAKLLRHNYRKFESWPLAITAYNHGTAGVLKARRSKGDYEAIFNDYRSRRFRFASRNFYSEFLAACRVADNYRTYFGDLNLDEPLSFQEVKLNGLVSLPRLINRFQLDRAIVYRLNPALGPAVLKGQRYVPKGFYLRLPVADNVAYTAGLESLYQVPSQAGHMYTVRKGDTAGKIASYHRVRLEDLIAANGLDAYARVYPNQKLKIPSNHEIPAAYRGRKATTGDKVARLAPAAESATETQSVFAANGDWQTYGPVFPSEVTCPAHLPDYFSIKRKLRHKGQSVGVVQVKVEETIGHYAEWLDVPAREIRHLNGIRYGRALRLNQSIKVPLDKASQEEFEARRLAYHQGLAEEFFSRYRVARTTTYTVQKGDSIWKLANENFNVPVWLIKRFNSDTDFAALAPARKLIIPVVNERRAQKSV